MTALVRPTTDLAASWIETIRDFGDPEQMPGSGTWNLGPVEPTVAGCAAFVAGVLACEGPHGSRVPSTFLWITDGDETDRGRVIGFLNLRHALNDNLRADGGHIGYSIRPGRRREGHATRALTLGVDRARALGVDRVLVTCDSENIASARTIERCGGVLADEHSGKRRYWITGGDWTR